MSAWSHSQPTPGHPVARGGKPWINAKWLSNILGGNQCLWAPWFLARFRHAKYEVEAFDLAQWNRDHAAMMRERVAELRENGWQVRVESENDFRLQGEVAILSGKPDLVATMGQSETLVVDGKTGRERESDWWQVAIYLFVIPIAFPELPKRLNGEIQYKQGDVRKPVRMIELTADRRNDIVQVIRRIAGPEPPRAPSRHECRRCTIGPLDCPERFVEREAETIAVKAGF